MDLNLCPNCFESGYQNGSCIRCGYQSAIFKARGKNALPAGVLLKNRYYIGVVLGEGGFGITYKAYDIREKRVCAIKEYAPNECCVRAGDRQMLEPVSLEAQQPYLAGLKRFLTEAQILSKLERIPSVVDITDTFQENNTAYFAMEYLDGSDLKRIVRLSQKRLPVEQVVDIILQVALSMDVIHTKTKIIHRDISPENIYITKDKKVKLIDFGSARQTENGYDRGLSVLVKLKFAPPEQFSTEMVQGSFTDVYALAGTYYYAQTGMYLPSAPDRQGGKDYVPLKLMNIGVPDGISDAIDHALVLNVRQRTQTMQQFIREITNGMPGGGIQPAKQPVKQPQKETPKPAPVKKQVELPYVMIVSEAEKGNRWVINPGQTMKIGRSAAEANIRIQFPQNISRVHCLVTYLSAKKKFCIRDTSTFGVFYKGKRLRKGTDYEVAPPARFALADSSCIIEVGVAYEHH